MSCASVTASQACWRAHISGVPVWHPADFSWADNSSAGCDGSYPNSLRSDADVRRTLTFDQLRRSRAGVGQVERWRRALCKAKAGERLRLAVLGDSVTCGHQCAGVAGHNDLPCAWPARLLAWLNRAYPVTGASRGHRLNNLCHSSAAIAFGADAFNSMASRGVEFDVRHVNV